MFTSEFFHRAGYANDMVQHLLMPSARGYGGFGFGFQVDAIGTVAGEARRPGSPVSHYLRNAGIGCSESGLCLA